MQGIRYKKRLMGIREETEVKWHIEVIKTTKMEVGWT